MQPYKDEAYAYSRLRGCMILYKGTAAVVNDIEGSSVSLQLYKDGQTIGKYINLSSLDPTPVLLGYVNVEQDTYYACRAPMRRDWRQGLRRNNLVDVNGQGLNLGWYDLANTVVNNFPSWKTCMSKLTNLDVSSIAFSRNFSVNIEGTITYKGVKDIGKIKLNGERVIEINKNCDFVTEQFNEEFGIANEKT